MMFANDLMNNMSDNVASLFARVRDDFRFADLGPQHLSFLLSEHTIFSKQNVIFLEQAALRTAGIKALASELRRNLDEELGHDEEHGEHHYDLYTGGLRDAVGIDVRGYRPTRHTCAFMGRMLDLSTAPTQEVICGAIFASEMVAVPELEFMRDVAAAYSQAVFGRPIDTSSQLHRFYDMHLSGVEQAHRDGLAEFVLHHADYGLDIASLKLGFDAAIASMSAWWSSLANDVREARLAAA